jgi:hypothetical protein
MNQSRSDSPYYDIILTDITLHTNPARDPQPWYKKVLAALKKNKPGRFFVNNAISKSPQSDVPRFSIPWTVELQAEKEKAELAGKIFRVFVPKAGLPIFAGKDTQEKIAQIKSKERNQIIHTNRGRTWHKE